MRSEEEEHHRIAVRRKATIQLDSDEYIQTDTAGAAVDWGRSLISLLVQVTAAYEVGTYWRIFLAQ